MTDVNPNRMQAADLARFMTAVFEAAGMAPADATILARSLLEADRGGVTTHGSARVAAYVQQLESGQINARPQETIVHDRLSALLFDGDNGFGAPVGIRAIDAAMVKARDTGVCYAGVTNVAHFGAAGFFTRYAAEHNYLALAMSSTSPSVVPFGGRTPRIGNSPISFAAPGTTRPELVMDVAQSMTSRGRLKIARERGDSIPQGWAIDAHGNPTTDPQSALNGGVLPSGGHKGSAMSLVVEMLASGLTGAHLSQDITNAGFTNVTGAGDAEVVADVTVGNAYLVIDADVFGTGHDVRSRASRIADHVRRSPAAPTVDRVLAPGDREREHSAAGERDGITLLASTVDSFADLSQRYGITLPPLFDRDEQR